MRSLSPLVLAAAVRCATSGTRSGMRWTRTAKSCGPGTPTLALRFAGLVSRNDGGKRARSPGREASILKKYHEINDKELGCPELCPK
jgi:hypothetical protein